MPTDERSLWRAVERKLDLAIPESVRDYCRCLGLTEDWDTDDEDERGEAEETIVWHVTCLRDAGLLDPAPRAAGRAVEITSDARWRLLDDIGRRFDEKYRADYPFYQTRGFAPLRTSRRHESSYPPSDRVTVDFDARMSRTALFAEIDALWETFRSEGWVRPTRRLGDRAIALLRFVALESPEGAQWRTRLELWNERYRERWPYKDVRAFHAAFRRAERQLIGWGGGLKPLYLTHQEWVRHDQEGREALKAQIRAAGLDRDSLLRKRQAGEEPGTSNRRDEA